MGSGVGVVTFEAADRAVVTCRSFAITFLVPELANVACPCLHLCFESRSSVCVHRGIGDTPVGKAGKVKPMRYLRTPCNRQIVCKAQTLGKDAGIDARNWPVPADSRQGENAFGGKPQKRSLQ